MQRDEARCGGRRAGSIWAAAALLLALAGPVSARDVLGIFGKWGAFRDAREGRCFAIAEPGGRRDPRAGWQPFASIGFWPRQGVRGQVNIRLRAEVETGGGATLSIGGKRFALAGGGADVWAKDRRDDAAIVAALRAGGTMTVRSRARGGASVSDQYELRGAATAIDAAALACARIK